MNPLRYAKALAWTVVLLVGPPALRAQTPCDAKKSYDDAKKKADAAATDLNNHQTKNKLPPGKLQGGKASLDAELIRTKEEAATADKLLKDAETALTDAEQDKSKFDADADKGKRLTALTGLIAKHKADIEKAKQGLDSKKSVIDQLEAAKKTGAEAETDVKKLMTGIQLGSNASDIDDAKKQVDDDMAQFEKAFQANQPPELTWFQQIKNALAGGGANKPTNSLPPVTTAMQCPTVTEKNRALALQQAIREKHLNDYQNVDQNSPNAAGSRSASLQAIKNSEDQMANDLKALRTAVQACQQEVLDGLKTVGSKRTELESLDPGSKIRDQQEELKKLEADKSLENESRRLTAEQKVLDGLVSSAKTNITNSKAAKAAADANLQEIEKSLTLDAEEKELDRWKPSYDAAVVLKDAEVKSANDDLAAAKKYLDDLAEVKKQNAEHKKLKKPWDDRVAAWKKKKEAWEAGGKDPAGGRALVAEKAQLLKDKIPIDKEKAKLEELLKAKGWKGDKNKTGKQKICDTKDAHKQALANRKAALDEYKCFPDAATAITNIDTRTKALGALIRERPVNVLGLWGLAGWSRTPRGGPAAVGGPIGSRPALLAALDCSIEDAMLEEDLEALDQANEDELEDPGTEEPTDSVPGDVTSGTGEVKVPRYYVFLLTNASNGLYVGDEDELKKSVRCGFVGGGIGCKPTDLITYKKLHGPFATSDEAQAALCQSVTETRYFPVGIGLKGRWQGSNVWYGLWNASVSGCPKR